MLRQVELMYHAHSEANLASTISNDVGQRKEQHSKGRGVRNSRGQGNSRRGKGNHRGVHKGKERMHSSDSRRNNGNYNDKARKTCGFCSKPGHWQKDCTHYMRARNQFQNQAPRNGGEQSHLVKDSIIDDRLDYSSCQHSANIVIETALMSAYHKPSWKIDSGASKHFSGKLSDFSSLKTWSSPKLVSIVDGNTCACEGYGIWKIRNSKVQR